MNRFLNFLKLILGWPLSLAALFFIFQRIISKTENLSLDFKQINVQLLIYGIICFLIYFFLRSYLWQKILKTKGYHLIFKESAYLWAASELKRFVPGNIWAFLGRAMLFSEKGISKKTIASSMLIEIEFFIFGTFIVSLLAISFIAYNLLPSFYPISLIIYFIFFITIVGVILFIFNHSLLTKYFNRRPFNLLIHILPVFSPQTNMQLLSISIIYSFFFGLGNYLVISSFVYLTPVDIYTFIGLFTFSLLVGFLSIVTPMGLGVREGIIAAGLAKFIPLDLAGLASVFTRLVLIFAELIFIASCYLWRTTKDKTILKFEELIKRYRYETILLFLIAVYIIYFTNFSFLRFDNFYTGRFDLGNMDQTVWNTMRGKIFQFTDPDGTEIISRLAAHADFILILVTPFYFIWANPKMLLLIQTFVLGFGALFIFFIAKEVLKNKKIALLFSFLYLLNPGIEHANLYDFHGVTLATTFLLGTYYFLKKEKYFLFSIFAILSAICKEQIWIVISFFGFYIFIVNFKENVIKKIFGIIVFITSLLIFYFLISYAIPNARGSQHFALSYYSDFGNSPNQVIKNLITSPHKIFNLILQPDRLSYLFQLFFPLGFLSFFSPLLLVFILPDLTINLLSSNSQLRQIYFQYNAVITPFIFISALSALKALRKWFPKIDLKIYLIFIFLTTLCSNYLFGPLVGMRSPNLDMVVKPQPYKETISGFISRIPEDFSIAATNNLGSHLSHRQKIFTIPIGIDKADIILFLLNDPFAQPSLPKQKEMVENLKRDKNYIQVFKQDDFIVFEKRNLYLQPQPKIAQEKLFPLSIPALQHRDYPGGEIEIENKVFLSTNYLSFIISYLSDGLKLYALMNVPAKAKPEGGFPILIINHGYINPKNYSTINSYAQITDYFSSNGFLVVKPDYRGHGISESDENGLERFSYPIDVLNLISSLENITEANKEEVYLFGHSLGGEVTLKILEVAGQDGNLAKKIKATVIWAPVTNTIRWFNKRNLPLLPETKITPFPYQKTFQILGTPEQNPILWQSLSPSYYLKDINKPLLIIHGTEDESVHYEWSIELYENLISLNKNAKIIIYPNNDHNLTQSWNQAIEESIKFYWKNAK